MDLLRFFTAGNVDDGKSTLIGRLLFDSNAISTDIIEALTRQSKNKTEDTDIDLALLTDGLRSEREQGITIDVAYKYFTTEKRKFIIADTPGHTQYTRNMFTGASTADLAIILVDVANGITEQTKRHSILSSILGIPNILICINKMDLVGFNQAIYDEIIHDYQDFATDLNLGNIDFIPVSALDGENIVRQSSLMPWYQGPTLMSYLETVQLNPETCNNKSRFQVQYVSSLLDPDTNNLSRIFLGKVLSGHFNVGQEIVIYPEGITTKIKEITKYNTRIPHASKGDIIAIKLENEIDVSRGNTFVAKTETIRTSQEITGTICWMDNNGFKAGQKLVLQQNAFTTKARIAEIISKTDINKNVVITDHNDLLQLNDIGRVRIKTAQSLVFDPYYDNREAGGFILIDENSHNTVAAGVFDDSLD